MSPTLRHALVQDAPDAHEPQAASGRSAPEGAGRRGPFRPGLWRNAREREGVRLAPHLFRLIDVGLAVCAAALLLAAMGGPRATLAEAAPVLVAAFVTLAALKGMGAYDFAAAGRLGQPQKALAAALAGAVAGAVVALITVGSMKPGLEIMAMFGAAFGLAHLAYALLVRRWRRGGLLAANVVVVGATRDAQALIEAALKRGDLNVLGVFDDRKARAPENVAGVPVLGTSADLLTHRLAAYVDRVVVAVDPAAQARVRALVSRLSALPNDVTLLIDPREGRDLDRALERLAGPPFVPLEPPNDGRRAFGKRLQDLVIGGLMLVALAPVIAATALAVRLDSPGPVFFRQRRHGFSHEEIVVWKFRSMRHEAADATASRQVTHDDDRVTRVGRFIRATSLDELPQLFNVMTGEMSLVGPRPHAIGMKTGETESARLVADYARRHRIKPGLTGWAAIHGSRGPLHTPDAVRERVRLDVEYIERQSFWLDLRIMAVTLPVLLGDRTAAR